MAAPAYSQSAPRPATTGAINNHDVEDWKQRLNGVLAKPSEVVKSSSPATAQPWHNSLFGCCSPIDLCLITYCLPCVTFGKTHHRLRKNGEMEGYEPINTTCLLFCASGCVGLHWIPMSMQRADLRDKYHLRGNCATDMATACCCVLCDLVQQEKESEHREPLVNPARGVQQGYQTQGAMAYPAPAAHPPASSAPVQQEQEKGQEGTTTVTSA
ncbi:hypothetical protein KVR01_004690 [Diaporthe batatas]|uniref:uncharacterized protein n=1 Tax=Diaporthe batatas TaxID=748121 RepID=UPI001D045C02|nr:uncharacterized protein KVR01_004690 [Diaporthe batatas]KAG8166138.1 hypothetical protein KVR01_004690 [Diaporthe batatas]